MKAVILDRLKSLSLYDLVLRAPGDDNALKDLRCLLSEGRKSTLAVVRHLPTPTAIAGYFLFSLW
jgi:hypothetical protein